MLRTNKKPFDPKTLLRRAAIFIGASVLALTMGFTTGPEQKNAIKDPLLRELIRNTVVNPTTRLSNDTIGTISVLMEAVKAKKLDPKTIESVMRVMRENPQMLQTVVRTFSFKFCTDKEYQLCEIIDLLIRDAMIGSLSKPQNSATRDLLVQELHMLNSIQPPNGTEAKTELQKIVQIFAGYSKKLGKPAGPSAESGESKTFASTVRQAIEHGRPR